MCGYMCASLIVKTICLKQCIKDTTYRYFACNSSLKMRIHVRMFKALLYLMVSNDI